jgi:hypothetical protein
MHEADAMKYVKHCCPNCFEVYEELIDDTLYPRRRDCQSCGEKMNKPEIIFVKRKAITGRKVRKGCGLLTPSDGD